jgi:hypothetical protein
MGFCTHCGAPVTGPFCPKCGTRVGSAPEANLQSQPSAPAGAPAYQAPVSATGAPATKKRGPWLWILLGCGGLIVIAGIIAVSTGVFVAYKAKQAGLDPALMQKNPGLAVAKMLVAVNPDVEVLSVDEDRGIIKVKDKKTGKTLTVNLEDDKKGKIVFQDDKNQTVELQAQGEGDKAALEVRSADGTMRMGAGAVQLPEWLPAYPGAEGTGTFGMSSKEGKAGTYTFKTNDSVEDVATFYEDALKGAGFTVQKTSTQIPGQGSMIILAARDTSSQRTAQITASKAEEGTTVGMTFETKK